VTRRLVLLAALALLACAPAAAAEPQRFQVVVVAPGGRELAELTLDELEDVPGAVGLLVPDAGPTTSRHRAVASLLRGERRNSLRGDPPAGPPLVEISRLGEPAGSRGRIVLALPARGEQANDRRYPIAVIAPGFRGLLTSRSTRIPGLVSIADVAPAALGEDVLSSTPDDDPVAALRALDGRIRDNGTSRLPASVLAAVAIVGLAFWFPRAAVAAYAAGAGINLLLGAGGVSHVPTVLVALGLGTAAAAVLLARVLKTPLALGLLLAGVLAAYAAGMAIDTTWVALSPLGPTQNARFYGISNLLETMLLVPALAGAALLGRRLGPAAFAGAALLALVTVASSRLGADGGGALVLAGGFAVLGVTLVGGGRRAWIAGAATGAAAVLAIAVDAVLGPSTHVGESVRGGPGELASDLAGRLSLSWERATSSPWAALVVTGSLVALAFLAARLPRLEVSREARALLVAFLAAIVVSLLVNDSPGDVAAGGLVGYLALEAFARRPQPTARGLQFRLPLPRSST
jgi:hypothetical protein